MKWFTKCALLMTILYIIPVIASDVKIKEEVQAMSEKIELLKTLHLTDVTRLKRDIEDLKDIVANLRTTNNHERNEQTTLQWAKASMKELRLEMKELSKTVNNSALLRQLHNIRNELKQALMETSDLAQLARTQETRIDKMDSEVGRLKYEAQQMRGMIVVLRTHVGKLAKELKQKQMQELINDRYNDVIESRDEKSGGTKHVHSHKYRHNKMIHTQIARLARSQDQLDEYQLKLQTQMLDVQRRIDRYEEPNWNLLAAKIDYLEISLESIRNEVKNTSLKLTDLNRLHASLLELREEIENIENKADKTIPEFRKEISKLDINFAQLNAQASYLKEDQENLRQSVKAIAVSVSNAIDRAEMDRLLVKKVNDSVADLVTRSKQHFYRLNDHILKSESNPATANFSEGIPLPELMGEVKELQPVKREYEDLVHHLPKDCSTISDTPGTYLINPGNGVVEAWCANGSTVIQRRYNGTVEFNRKFSDYVDGFGDTDTEYWIGLEPMHRLTSDNCSSMRIDMTDIYGGHWYAKYEYFSVGSSDTGYELEVRGFEGNASDAFEYQNHMEFSAIDHDRDISNTHCAGNYEGGWWFSHCQHVNINGKYTLGLTWFDSAKNEWIAVATTEMRVYRRAGCY